MSYVPFKMSDLEGLKLSKASRLETKDGEDLLALVLLSHLVWTVRVDDQIVSIVGCNSPTLMSGDAFLWCVTTVAMEVRGRRAMRYHMKIVDNLRDKFHSIQGVVSPESSRWVKMLGFYLGELVECDGQPYHVFSWSR